MKCTSQSTMCDDQYSQRTYLFNYSYKYNHSHMCRRIKKLNKQKYKGIIVPLSINTKTKVQKLPKIQSTFLYNPEHNESNIESPLY